jgi:hypothetical protein
MEINAWRFVESLKYMGMGMLGIIGVMAAIIIITMVLSKVTAPKKSNNQQ